ncbi:hypothetical protein [uncultured Abiotrophia sp.]|uniref:hypothetical protein n=1 Tax=uncultured Abiotrophia sp. TaxID=316094 RepID=UPI002888F910|nr:hypothetical protein [uncultured Abiotrophia sp.]
MRCRITGFNLPIFGLNWEYPDKTDKQEQYQLHPTKKIRVFISSVCGDNKKFNQVRKRLKKLIEDTGVATVYLFEDEEASTLSAGTHYKFNLIDCNVCIFLIDNKVGVTPGVQEEIDIAKRHNIKSFYYFCDEDSVEKTEIEKSLQGAQFAKSKTVHNFQDLGDAGAKALIEDLITVYLIYCKDERLFDNLNEENNIRAIEPYRGNRIFIPRVLINSCVACVKNLGKIIIGDSESFDDEYGDLRVDEWGSLFLKVLFRGDSIRKFNTELFLDDIGKDRNEESVELLKIRWCAIQAYFLGDLEGCIGYIKKALEMAKKTDQPKWLVNDILIDLRNQESLFGKLNNTFYESEAQKELSSSEERVHYPWLDRVDDIIQKKYIRGMFKEKTDSPFSVTYSNEFNELLELITESYIISLYNGSLTQILLLYGRVRDLQFYFSEVQGQYASELYLLKYAIFECDITSSERILKAYPRLFKLMGDKDAAEILRFCFNQPIKHMQNASVLLGMGTIGYFLSNQSFDDYEKLCKEIIDKWFSEEDHTISLGKYIFKYMAGIVERVSHNWIANVCGQFLRNKYRYWYRDLFEFMDSYIDLNQMDPDVANEFIQQINDMLEDENALPLVRDTPSFLSQLRKQNLELTRTIDKKISELLPNFYCDNYRIETSCEAQKDYVLYIHHLIDIINNDNEQQGKEGMFFVRGTRSIATIQNLLMNNAVSYDKKLVSSLVDTLSNTLIQSKEGIDIKIDAISLMMCIVAKYPDIYREKKEIYDKVLESEADIIDVGNTFMESNIGKIALQIALSLLKSAMGFDSYSDFFGYMSHIQNDKATIISVMRVVANYLEVDNRLRFSDRIELALFQNVLIWLNVDYLDVKFHATRVLLMLGRGDDNREILNQALIRLVDYEGVAIKRHILWNIHKVDGINDRTKEYIFLKCQKDPCYLVRKTCEEMMTKYRPEISNI